MNLYESGSIELPRNFKFPNVGLDVSESATVANTLIELQKAIASLCISSQRMTSDYLTMNEACEYFNMSRSTLKRILKSNPQVRVKLPTGGVRVLRVELEKSFRQRRISK